MSDLISRQAAIDAVRHSPIIEVQPAYMLIDKGDVLKNLIIVPSAQPEIIYCKDCRHNRNCEIQYHAQAGDMFFCGAGERRTDYANVIT